MDKDQILDNDQILDLIHSNTATLKIVKFRSNKKHRNGEFMKIFNKGEKIANKYYFCIKCDKLIKRTTSTLTNHCKRFHQECASLPAKQAIETSVVQDLSDEKIEQTKLPNEKIEQTKLDYPNSIQTKVEYPNCIQFFEIKNYYQMSDKTHP